MPKPELNVPISEAQQNAMFEETYEATKRLLLATYPNIAGTNKVEIQELIDASIHTAVSNLIGGASSEADTLRDLEDKLKGLENELRYLDDLIYREYSLVESEELITAYH